MQQYEYFVMDSRAGFDLDSAAVYESIGRSIPKDKELRCDWGGMGAYLVRAPVTKNLPDGGSECGEFEIVSVIE